MSTINEPNLETKQRFLCYKASKLNKSQLLKILDILLNNGQKELIQESSDGTRIILNFVPENIIDELYRFVVSSTK